MAPLGGQNGLLPRRGRSHSVLPSMNYEERDEGWNGGKMEGTKAGNYRRGRRVPPGISPWGQRAPPTTNAEWNGRNG